MTIKELKEKIKDLPDDMPVYIATNEPEYDYMVVNTAFVGKIWIGYDMDNDKTIDAFILDEQQK